MGNPMNSTEVKDLYIAQLMALNPGTTPEQWERYDMDKRNHEARIHNKTTFLNDVLKYAKEYGIENTEKHFKDKINQEWSMDAPNMPGYYRANND